MKISASLVGALEECWGAIRRRHGEVPAAVLVVASGTDGPRGGARWGPFAALRWVRGDDQLPEVWVAGSTLAAGAIVCELCGEGLAAAGDAAAG